MEAFEKFETKTAEISLGGKAVTVRTMRAMDVLKAAKLVAKNKEAIAEQIPAGVDDIGAVIGLLSACETDLPELVSALAGAPVDAETLREMSIVELSQLARAVTTVNDFSAVKENFTAAFATMKTPKA